MPISLSAIIGEILSQTAAVGVVSVVPFILGKLKLFGDKKQETDIESLFAELAGASQEQIDKCVEQWRQNPQVESNWSDEMVEELKHSLYNLARNARMVSSTGRASSYLRSDSRLEQLVSNINVSRKRGDEAGDGVNWILEKYLGAGAFGEVWTGWDMNNPHREKAKQNPRAFKFFTKEGAAEWIRQEKDNLYEIRDKLPEGHPHIVRFIDISIQKPPNHSFIVFEYVRGGSLEDWLVADVPRRVKLNKGQIMRGLIDGMAAAHQKGVYHRDLKPANILLSEGENPQAKIGDFGLAKVQAIGPNSVSIYSSLSTDGVRVGTRMYLPPEADRSFAYVDPGKQDVFAIGVIWYQLCVEALDRPPYNFRDRLAKNPHGPLDSHTISLISRCLAHPDDRFANALELQEALWDIDLPDWTPPPGCYDVQHIVREFITAAEV